MWPWVSNYLLPIGNLTARPIVPSVIATVILSDNSRKRKFNGQPAIENWKYEPLAKICRRGDLSAGISNFRLTADARRYPRENAMWAPRTVAKETRNRG